MAARISGVGRVTVSERKSIIASNLKFLRGSSHIEEPAILIVLDSCFYGIWPIGSSMTGVIFPSFDA
jgi:hypothetical protein